MKREVILKLQQFIIERENADKRRQYKKENEELRFISNTISYHRVD